MQQKIIDTHVHIWDFEKASYDWLKNDTSILNRNYQVQEYDEVRKAAGITEAVLVQAANNLEDTALMLEAAEQHDFITGVVGWLPLTDPDQVAKLLQEKYAANPNFKGVRHLVHDEPDSRWLLQERVIESLQVISDMDFTYDLVGVLNEHIETALELASRVNGLQLVFDHINQPPISTGERFGKWGDLMKAAADNPNFYIKISGLGNTCKNSNSWTAADIQPYIEFAFEKFGASRCFCGGNWPVSLLAGDFNYTWQVYREAITNLLPVADQEKVFYSNAKKFYRL